MRSPFRPIRLFFISAALSFGIGGLAQPGPVIGPDFLNKLAQAVNKQDVAALRAMTQTGVENDFRWATKGKSVLAPDRAWQAKALTVPWISDSAQNSFVNVTKYHPCESTGDHLYRISFSDNGPKLGSEITETDTTGYRIRDHKLSVRFDLSNRRVHVTDRIKVEQKTDRMAAAMLRLNAIYTVTALSRDGAPVEFQQAGGVVAVKPADGDQAVYDLVYTAKIGTGPEDYILDNQAGLTSYWYAHTGRLPATHEVAITVPRGWTAIGQGERLGKNVGESETTYTYSNKLAVCYFTVAAGKYIVTTRKVGGIDVSAYLLRGDAERALSAIDTAAGALQWFSQNFSPYPYSSYAVVETNVFPAALECYSFTLCAANYIPIAIVHEVAHTWWGGIVPNTYTRTLWNESFAEYSDGLYGRVNQKPGLHEFNARVMGAMIPMLKDVTLVAANDAMEMKDSAVGYGKGSIVLENLERLLGRPKMVACMQRFIKNHSVGEDAEWQDFIKAVMDEAGPEWAAFFPPWLNRSELPKLSLSGVKASRENGAYLITGSLTQPAPAFWIDTPLLVQSTAGSRIVWVPVKGTNAPFRIETASAPIAVWLDPQYDVLRSLPGTTPGPDLLKLQTVEGAVLVIYSTGGPAVETVAAKKAAATVRELTPYAKPRIRPDSAVTPAELQRSSVIFVGKPQYLLIPPAWRSKLAFRFTSSTITDTLAGLTSAGKDLWAASVTAHPANSRWIMAHIASTSPQALRGIRFLEGFPMTESRVIATAGGKLVAARRSHTEAGEVAYVAP